MKRAVKYLFSAFVIVLYVISYMGFGKHLCNTDHTASLVLMTGDLSCEAIHERGTHHQESGCCEHHEHHEHHSGCDCGLCDSGCECHNVPGCYHFHSTGCCSTDFFAVTDAQDSDNSSQFKYYQQVSLIACVSNTLAGSYGIDAATDFRSRGIPISAGVHEAILGVWRL